MIILTKNYSVCDYFIGELSGIISRQYLKGKDATLFIYDTIERQAVPGMIADSLLWELGRTVVLLVFLGVAGWTLRSITRIWLPVIAGKRSAWA